MPIVFQQPGKQIRCAPLAPPCACYLNFTHAAAVGPVPAALSAANGMPETGQFTHRGTQPRHLKADTRSSRAPKESVCRTLRAVIIQREKRVRPSEPEAGRFAKGARSARQRAWCAGRAPPGVDRDRGLGIQDPPATSPGRSHGRHAPGLAGHRAGSARERVDHGVLNSVSRDRRRPSRDSADGSAHLRPAPPRRSPHVRTGARVAAPPLGPYELTGNTEFTYPGDERVTTGTLRVWIPSWPPRPDRRWSSGLAESKPPRLNRRRRVFW
ncbi:hypothetical protein GCM10011583_46190 [Streptomyces camponoticapitis]|uniref:Uncharacterized protein n=1 Tax=Streptomyces camponoticapitis TaxID=1616125 RepID=A0ABQ2EHK5_9ACTN|nr:hypothetical protein GCM10011583_46190 [Streptomyces camponoticapitis]